MTKEMLFNNKYFNIFVLFINTVIGVDILYFINVNPTRFENLKLVICGIFTMLLIYYLFTRRIKVNYIFEIIILLIIIGISMFWSVEEVQTVRFYLYFIGGCAYLLLFFLIAKKENIINILKIYSNLIILFNFISIWFDIGRVMEDSKTIYIKGLHESRSAFGMYLVFGIFMNLIYIYEYKKKFKVLPKVPFFFIVLAIATIVIGKSSTAIIIIALLPILIFFINNRIVINIFLGGSLAMAIFIPLMNLNSSYLNSLLVKLFNKSLTFSGRKYIWDYVLENLRDNKLLGNGFNSTKKLLDGVTLENYSQIPNHSHNGFIELLLQNGYVGLILILAIIFLVIRISNRISNAEVNVLKIYLVAVIIFNLMEPFIISSVAVLATWIPILLIICNAMKQKTKNIIC